MLLTEKNYCSNYSVLNNMYNIRSLFSIENDIVILQSGLTPMHISLYTNISFMLNDSHIVKIVIAIHGRDDKHIVQNNPLSCQTDK